MYDVSVGRVPDARPTGVQVGDAKGMKMKIANSITYTMPRGPGSQPYRYEQTTTLVHDRALTYKGAQRILNKRLGLNSKNMAMRAIVTRIETAVVS